MTLGHCLFGARRRDRGMNSDGGGEFNPAWLVANVSSSILGHGLHQGFSFAALMTDLWSLIKQAADQRFSSPFSFKTRFDSFFYSI